MHPVTNENFAAELCRRSQRSQLIDATTGKGFVAADVSRVATKLRETGLRPGDFSIVASGVDPETALVYLGAIYGGIMPIPVAEADLDRQIHAIRSATGASFLWTKRGRVDDAARAFDGLQVMRGVELEGIHSSAPVAVSQSDLAVLMPTSGSTGVPKLVQVTHGNLLANTVAIVNSQRLTGDDRAMLVLPVNYCFGASVLHTHLLTGGDVVFDRRMMFPDKIVDSIARFACSTFAGVPTIFKSLLRRPRFTSNPPVTLRKVFQAGGALDTHALQRLCDTLPHAEVFVMYGQTEATARISTLEPADMNEHLGTVGRPLDGVELRVVGEPDQGGIPANNSPGNEGEIWVRGSSVTLGYWCDQEATAQKFQNGWLRTGDIGSIDVDGYLSVTGRLGSFVKVRGLRVALGEVETLVHQLDEVEDAAACGVGDEDLGESVMLFLIPTPGASEAITIARARQMLPAQWAVQRIHVVDRLPRTSNNKIDRARLQEMAKRVAA